MDAEVKAKWIAALRSGEYEQGHHELRHVSNSVMEYCCLGVLCELMDGWGEMPAEDDELLVDGAYKLPLSVQQELALLNDGGSRYNKNGELQETVQPHDFNQIANYIEANL